MDYIIKLVVGIPMNDRFNGKYLPNLIHLIIQ